MKTILIARFEMTPSVNEMYANIEPGTNKNKPAGGRVLKKEYKLLKEQLTDGLFNGFFIEGGIDKIYYMARRYVDEIREIYDKAKFYQSTQTLTHKFSIEIMVVFKLKKDGKERKADGDNRIKFIQDLLAAWIGIDDSQINHVKITSVHADVYKPYVNVVVKHTDETFQQEELIVRALQELSFENMTEEEFKDLPDEATYVGNL